MTFKIEDDEAVFHCDSCPEHIECEGRSDFKGGLIFAKQKGWRSYKGPDHEWAHACPSCTEDFQKEQRR